MRQVIIENPVINSPFDEPSRHFRFDDEGITNDIVEERRISSYFIPIAQPRKKDSKQLRFDTEWTKDRIEENKVVNRIRQRVGLWRKGGYLGVTPTTSKLFEYWTKPERERKLFFCQLEALETAIYIAEVAKKYVTITTLFFKLSINVSYLILWVKNDQATIRIEKSRESLPWRVPRYLFPMRR